MSHDRLTSCSLSRQDHNAEILTSYRRATQLDPEWYKAWHEFSLRSFEIIQHFESQPDLVDSDVFATYVVPAVQGAQPVPSHMLERA